MKIPEKPPAVQDFGKILQERNVDFAKVLSAKLDDSRYLSFEDTKYRPVPEQIKAVGGDRLVWWIAIMFGRIPRFQELPLSAADGGFFKFFCDNIDAQLLHDMDLNGGGMLGIGEMIPNENERNKYFVNMLIEESFSSSFMEGAVSTCDLAKKMIAENREPKNKSERMILNNFKTMQSLSEWKDELLSPELLRKIHSHIARGTLDESKLGKFRTESDGDIVLADDEGNVYHTPCGVGSIPEKIAELCDFANSDNSGSNFIHPVVKAVILHFMLAYIHPFCDGNGRTARTLFYWYLLKNNYWIVKFISISKIIVESGNRYYMSFLNTERDYNDLNYFIKFQLEVFDRAIKAFYNYLETKKREYADISRNSDILKGLNEREAQLCLKIMGKPFENFDATIESYAILNGVSWETARQDLKHLAAEKILERRKSGKTYVYSPTKSFLEKIGS